MSARKTKEFRCIGMFYGVGGPPADPSDTSPEAEAVRQRVNAWWAAAIVAARQQEAAAVREANAERDA